MARLLKQYPFDFSVEPSFDTADFIVSQANADAVQTLANWQGGAHQHAAILVGPTGSGKSHLAGIWRESEDAENLGINFDISQLDMHKSVLLEDIDTSPYDPDKMFHLYNWIKENNGRLLMTARQSPQNMEIVLPDLASRLRSALVLKISPPDDNLLNLLFVKLLSDRQLKVDPSVITFAAARMTRSFAVARELVAELDRRALADKRKITWPLVKEILAELDNK